MADRVIVVGVTRGNSKVSPFEIAQMIGRSGRTQGGKPCTADIIVDEEQDIDMLTRPDAFKVYSQMDGDNVLSFHLLPEICSGSVTSVQGAEKWHARTLGYAQGIRPDFNLILTFLERLGAVERKGMIWSTTDLGRLASRFYFSPAFVSGWRHNFSEIFRMGLESDDLAIAWALGGVPMSISGDFGDYRFVLDECKNLMPRTLEIQTGNLISTTLWWSALCGISVGKMRGQMLQLRFDFDRICNVLLGLNKIQNWEKQKFFESLAARVWRGIPSHLLELCQQGLSKSRAEWAYNMGIRDIKDLEIYDEE